ncbi:exopolysaccharide production protein ExoY [Paracoccus chinensis]|uniref:Exopolysaccharide production protein ExoY n=2 Tax=Paracoccus chinensis TaxID=525640 RepID=A0A1G9MJ34_9RHOB|nr:exopolysaccharide production protein ExoY [Paracoccus chinensis]
MQMLRVQDLVAENGKAPLMAVPARPAPLRARPPVLVVPAAPVGGRAKRALDIGLVLLGLLLLWPLILGLVVLLKVMDPGPVLYGHRRVGFGGREFRCWKFRTMVVDGDAVLERHLRENPADAALWKEQRKLVNDPRVTPLGAVLRKLSLDELPQLLNVLKGEMSLVGPRPIVQAELDHYGISARHYLATRPGLTGQWQISGRSDTTYAERVRLDRFYVTNWSLWRDLRIIFLTIPAVALSRGAH